MRLPKFLRARDTRVVSLDNENLIVVEHVYKEHGSAPRLVLAFFFLVMSASTIGQQFYFQGERTQQIKDQDVLDNVQDARLQDQINYGRQQRILQREFLLELLAEPDLAKRQEITRQYVADSTSLDDARPRPITQEP